MRHRHAPAFAIDLQLLRDLERLGSKLGLQHAFVAASGTAVGGRRLTRQVFAGQHAAGQRAVGHNADAMVAAGFQHFHLGLPVEQVVIGLADHRPGHIHLPRQMHQLGDAPTPEIRNTPVADLAVAQQRLNGPQRLLEVHAIEVAVQVVDVDMVGIEPLQAGLTGAQHPGTRVARLVDPLGHRIAELGRQDPVMAPRLDQLTDHLLRGAG